MVHPPFNVFYTCYIYICTVVYYACTHMHTPFRVVIAVAIWAEVELNKNVQDVLDSADDVDGVLNQFGADVS